MRHPKSEKHRALAEAQLPEILKAVGMSQITSFRRETEGWVNLCYLFDDVVIRFNARDPELPKFRREAFIYDLLADRDIPTPKPLLYGDAGRFGEYPVLVTDRLPGRNLDADWRALGPETRRRLARDAGRQLAGLHEVEFSGAGEVFSPEDATWSEYLMRKARAFFRTARKLEIFTESEIAGLDKTIDGGLQAFAQIPEARLVHGDYHFGNLLYDGDKIVGIVDFEWCFAGDPAWDLIRAPKMDHYWPGSSTSFREGYAEASLWEPEFARRAELYRIVHLLEITIVAARFYSPDEARSYRERVLEAVDEL